MYKKRTEREVLQKFSNVDEEQLKEIIEYFKELGYISDNEYIEKAVKEYMNLNNLSIKELEYKLVNKGISKTLVDNYIYNNKEILVQYELESAEKTVCKKRNNYELEEMKQYLRKKGYQSEIIKVALEENYE